MANWLKFDYTDRTGTSSGSPSVPEVYAPKLSHEVAENLSEMLKKFTLLLERGLLPLRNIILGY
jgi:hypothetical protein